MKRNATNRKKIMLIALLVVLIGGGTGGVLLYKNRSQPDTTTERKPTINYEPATATEKQQVADNKERIVKDQDKATSNPPNTSQKKSVVPTITGTTGSIKGYVNGIFEEGGTCTATFSKNGTVLTRTSEGFQNVSYTQCAPIDISDGFLSSGTWAITLGYSSATAEGTSAAQNIEVN